VTNSTGSGILIRDSADLWLNTVELSDNHPDYAPLDADNSGLTVGQQGGIINIDGLNIETEQSGAVVNPAVRINQAAASIHGLTMTGNHSGIEWDGQNHNNYPSEISNSVFSGSGCVVLSNHLALAGVGNAISSDCSGTIQLVNSQVNWSGFTDSTPSSKTVQLDSNSDLHLHQPVNLDLNLSYPSMASGATIDVAYDLIVWVVNNNSNGIPSANVDVTFSQFEPTVQDSTNEMGYLTLTDFIGERWTNSRFITFDRRHNFMWI
jgi:hypothetical protein